MVMRIVCALVCLLALAGPARAQQEKGVFGAGLIVGEPTGVSVKYYLANDTAVDGALGFSALSQGLQLHSDFLWHPFILESQETFVLPIYVGLGLRVQNRNERGSERDQLRIGLRVVGGILFDFTNVPLDVFAEVAPVGDIRTKGTTFGVDINAGAGVRYYF